MSTHSSGITCPNCGVGPETDLAVQITGSGFEGVVTNQVGCRVCGLYANFAELRKTEGETLTEAQVVERATALLVGEDYDPQEIAEMILFDAGERRDLSTYSFGT
jgi:hypothetical protein